VPAPDTGVEADGTSAQDSIQEEDAAPAPDGGEGPDVAPEPDAVEENDVAPEPDVEEEPDAALEPDTEEPVATGCEEACPEGTVCSNGTCGTALCGLDGFDTVVMNNAALLASELLISQQPDLTWAPSQIYTWSDLMQGLATSCNPGFAGFSFWTGESESSSDNQAKATLINLAAFLAQNLQRLRPTGAKLRGLRLRHGLSERSKPPDDRGDQCQMVWRSRTHVLRP
jgi:hypothetical protein